MSALRKADVEVSPAETLDAMAALDLIGITNRQLIRDSLAIILAKSPLEKQHFQECFERFFNHGMFAEPGNVLAGLHQAAMAATSAGDTPPDASDDAGEGRRRRRSRGQAGPAHHTSLLGHLLLAGNADNLMLAVQQAANSVKLDQIRSLRERPLYARRILLHMGMLQLEEEIARLKRAERDIEQQTAVLLESAAQYLRQQVSDYVENQFLLMVDGSGQKFLAEAAANTQLTVMQPYYFDHVREAVRKLAQRLARRHAQRRRRKNRGQLNLHRTLRRNLVYDGDLFDLHWKQVHRERPQVFVICDVSGSVRNVARFLLTFLYSLGEVLPQVRAFAFSSDLGEISSYFKEHPLEQAIEMSLDDYGKGSTDYGKAFRQFVASSLGDMSSRATVIVLGDARNNYFANGSDQLALISRRCRQLVWLNPEPPERWREGDSEMSVYQAHCDIVDSCNSLKDLERIVSGVLQRGERA